MSSRAFRISRWKRHSDDGRSEPVRWKDDVLMLCEAGKWRIDDVAYGGDWDFSMKGRLREGLEAQ